MTSAGNNNTKLQPITSKRKAIHFHTTSRHVFRPSMPNVTIRKGSIKSVVCVAHNSSYISVDCLRHANMNRILNMLYMFPIIMFFVVSFFLIYPFPCTFSNFNILFIIIQIISYTHAASLDTGKAFRSIETNEIPLQSNEAIIKTAKPRLVAETTMLIIETNQRPVRIPRPFVLWWSTLTQSVLQLLRQRTPTTTSNPNKTFIATSPFPIFPAEDPSHNVNDIASGLDTITVDAPPVFDSFPLE